MSENRTHVPWNKGKLIGRSHRSGLNTFGRFGASCSSRAESVILLSSTSPLIASCALAMSFDFESTMGLRKVSLLLVLASARRRPADLSGSN